MKGVNLKALLDAGATVGPPVRIPGTPDHTTVTTTITVSFDLADALRYVLKLAGIDGWEPEYHFARPRQWRFDVAFPALRVAVECEGGIAAGVGHTDPERFRSDVEKYNEAALAGWLLLRVTGAMIKSGRALDLIERAVALRQ